MNIRRFYPADLLAGEVAVVTGGGSGLGYAIARDLVACGADVVITSRSAPRLEEAELRIVEETGRLCASFPCDIRKDDEIARLRDYTNSRFGKGSILVNNAAANFHMPAERMTRRAMETVVDIDLMGTFAVTRAFVPDMIEARRGAILSITVPSVNRGFPGFSHAGAAKAGIISLTGSWAREWGRYGIRVNALAPGPVPTEGVTVNMLGKDATDVPGAFAEHSEVAALGGLGTPEEIASAAVFLCSPAASWITGVNLTVDGGMELSTPLHRPVTG
ncbi:SDR family oxidoreductase [Streptomyces sp. NPDC059104]|uniref:SDR family oxidoreductase n=1 Tax=Streptomyces sp. NPDC059104 TaxID=3346729 RepID=UPI00367E957F